MIGAIIPNGVCTVVASTVVSYPHQDLIVCINKAQKLLEDVRNVVLPCRVIDHVVGIAPVWIKTIVVQDVNLVLRKVVLFSESGVELGDIVPEACLRSTVDHDNISLCGAVSRV